MEELALGFFQVGVEGRGARPGSLFDGPTDDVDATGIWLNENKGSETGKVSLVADVDGTRYSGGFVSPGG